MNGMGILLVSSVFKEVDHVKEILAVGLLSGPCGDEVHLYDSTSLQTNNMSDKLEIL